MYRYINNHILKKFILKDLEKIWVITDTHFFHENIIKYENRPENFNELIIQNWKNLVTDNDLVIHLGDVILKHCSRLPEITSQLPGIKILIKGNHDNSRSSWFEKRGFDLVNDKFFKLGDIVFSHEPIDLDKLNKEVNPILNGNEYARYNIHGHFHNAHRDDPSRTVGAYPFYSKRNLLLSIENENYRPVLLEELIKRFEK